MTLPPIMTAMRGLWRADLGSFTDLAGTTPATADSAVARVDSQGDNGIWVGQSTSGSRPLLKTAQTPGGNAAFLFDGSDDRLVLSNLFTSPETTLYAVAKITTISGVRTLVCGAQNSLQWRLDNGVQRLVSAGVSDIGSGSGTQSQGAWFQANVSWDLTNGIFRRNGSSDGSVSSANKGFATFRDVGRNLNTGGSSENFIGYLAMLAVYSAIHTLSEKQSMEAWITSEFGV